MSQIDKTRVSVVDKICTASKTIFTPVLLNFQNGELVDPEKKDLNFFMAKNEEKRDENLAVVATPSGVFAGAIGNGHSPDLLDTYVAIRNAKTGKVKLIQVHEANLFNSVYLETPTQKALELSKEACLSELYKNFGGKRAKRVLDRLERSKVNMDIVKDQLEGTAREMDLPEEVPDITEKTDLLTVRPPCNVEATKIDEVYKISDIISQELLDRLDEEAVAVLRAKTDTLPIPSDYILQKIDAIKKSEIPNSSKSMTEIKILLYMDALLALIKTRKRSLTGVNLSNITEKVENDIRLKFSQPEATQALRTSYSTHKAICYFIVLSLLTSDRYEIDLNTLVQEMSIARVKIVQFAQYVNAKPKANSDLLSLRLPSKVKIPRPGFSRKKRNN